jgi:hypothetical protein
MRNLNTYEIENVEANIDENTILCEIEAESAASALELLGYTAEDKTDEFYASCRRDPGQTWPRITASQID